MSGLYKALSPLGGDLKDHPGMDFGIGLSESKLNFPFLLPSPHPSVGADPIGASQEVSCTKASVSGSASQGTRLRQQIEGELT